MTKNRKCAHCKRRNAAFIIRGCFNSKANGKAVCRENTCFTALTGGYPAEGTAI